MKDFKLINLLKTFSEAEFKDFERFVSSPYFGRGRDLLPLFKAMKFYYPEFSNKDFTIENIYGKIFPEKKYGDAKSNSLMKTLISELYKMCLDFLTYSSLKDDAGRKSFYLLEQLRKRKHYIEFEKEYEKALNQKNPNKGGTSDFIEKYFLYDSFKGYCIGRSDFANSFEYTLATNEYIVAVALMKTFLAEDAKNLAISYNQPVRYSLMKALLENLNTEELISQMKKNNDRFYPYVLIYFSIYKMNKYKDTIEHYYELKSLLIEHKELFGQSENYDFWNSLITYLSTRGSNKELLSIYEHILMNNIYKKSDEEDFSIILFRNIIVDMSFEGKYEWMENFINKYSDELHKDYRESMFNFSHSYINFMTGNFEKALEHAGKINYDVFIFKMDVRILLLKIYFELSYFDQAFSLVDSTLHFIRNTTEFSREFKDAYNDFIKSFNETLKLKALKKPDSNAITFLETKIKGFKIMMQRRWLLKKIDEMKK